MALMDDAVELHREEHTVAAPVLVPASPPVDPPRVGAATRDDRPSSADDQTGLDSP